jgi:hypothetical protein
VIGACVEALRRQATADWQRVGPDLVAVSGTSPNWFPKSRKPGMTLDEFTARWCVGSVIARVLPPPPGAAGPGTLDLRLTAHSAAAATAAGNGGGAGGGGGGGAGGGGGGV